MSWIVDLKAFKLAEAIQDSGNMFQVVTVLGKNKFWLAFIRGWIGMNFMLWFLVVQRIVAEVGR